MRILLIVIVVIVILIGGLAVYMTIKNLQTPGNLGINSGKLAPMPSSPNAVSSQTDIEEKRVPPFPFKENLQDSKKAVLAALQAYGDFKIVRETDNYIHAVHTTKTMRYKDDLEFYFDQAEGVIHFRSASRVGYSDRGLNRARYEVLSEKYAGN